MIWLSQNSSEHSRAIRLQKEFLRPPEGRRTHIAHRLECGAVQAVSRISNYKFKNKRKKSVERAIFWFIKFHDYFLIISPGFPVQQKRWNLPGRRSFRFCSLIFADFRLFSQYQNIESFAVFKNLFKNLLKPLYPTDQRSSHTAWLNFGIIFYVLKIIS